MWCQTTGKAFRYGASDIDILIIKHGLKFRQLADFGDEGFQPEERCVVSIWQHCGKADMRSCPGFFCAMLAEEKNPESVGCGIAEYLIR